jgi:hypothetical protein
MRHTLVFDAGSFQVPSQKKAMRMLVPRTGGMAQHYAHTWARRNGQLSPIGLTQQVTW